MHTGLLFYRRARDPNRP